MIANPASKLTLTQLHNDNFLAKCKVACKYRGGKTHAKRDINTQQPHQCEAMGQSLKSANTNQRFYGTDLKFCLSAYPLSFFIGTEQSALVRDRLCCLIYGVEK